MDCRNARERLAETLGQPDTVGAELGAHLETCAGCAALAADAAAAHTALADLAEAEGEAVSPPANVAAVLRQAVAAPAERLGDPLDTAPPVRLLPRWGRFAMRVAVVLLACVGGLALLQARVEAGEGRWTLSLALPGAAAERPGSPERRVERVGPTHRLLDDAPVIAAASREDVEQVVETVIARHASLAPDQIQTSVQQSVREALRPEFRAVADYLVAAEQRQARSIVELLNVLEHRRAEGNESLALAFQELMRREVVDAKPPGATDGQDTPR